MRMLMLVSMLTLILFLSRIGAWKIGFGVLLLAGMVLTVKPPFIFGEEGDSNSSLTRPGEPEPELGHYLGVSSSLEGGSYLYCLFPRPPWP